MLKKLLIFTAALLMLSACAALADDALTFVITQDMRFYSGPGTQYTQTAFHNNGPLPGETAQVIGREGDWLLVCYTGHWFAKTSPVWNYLSLADAPEFADVPELSFAPERNALAVESANVYADPEGLTYDLYIHPDDSGLSVLRYEDDMAYVEAVNPYGFMLRGFISVNDLQQRPGASVLENAPKDTAMLLQRSELPLTYAPASQYMEVLTLADGVMVLRYDTVLPDGVAITLATVSASGELLSNQIIRERDGEEESVLNFLLPRPDGFSYCYAAGDDLTPMHEIWFTPEGRKISTATMNFGEGDEIETLGTAGFRIAEGRTVDAELSGRQSIPLRVTPTHMNGGTRMEIGLYDYISCAAECSGYLALPVCSGQDGAEITHLLLFDANAQLVSDTVLPGSVYDIEFAPAADGSAFLLIHMGDEEWFGFDVSLPDGAVTPTDLTLTIPFNRRSALLAASDGQVLLAVGGVNTQLLLTDGQTERLAAETTGTLLHAASDGQTATLLLMENGLLRTEIYSLLLP